MKGYKKFITYLLTSLLMSQSLLASETAPKYVAIRNEAEKLGYEVKWHNGEILLEDANHQITSINTRSSKEYVIIKNGVSYAEESWLLKLLNKNDETSKPAIDYTQLGLNTIESLIQGQYEKVMSLASDAIKAQIDTTGLAQQWLSLPQMFGPITSYELDQTLSTDGFTQVDVRLQCEKAPVKVTMVFDVHSTLHSLFFSPYALEASKPENMVEKDMVIQTEGYELPATLTLPNKEGSFPVVILVHGSGPNDRDETISGTKVFRDMAYGLAEKGIATLRYDKRTYVYSKEVSANPSLFDYEEEVIDDALSAVSLMQNTEGIDKEHIYVLGHSLGAMSIPMISQKDSGVKGYVMVSGPARNLIDVVLEQLDYLADVQGLTPEQKATSMLQVNALADIVRGLTQDSNIPELGFVGINNKVWADLNAYDQVAIAKTMTEPLLILQGGRDYQVTMEDFNLWKDALKDKSNVTFKDYPDLNHLLVTGEGKSTPNEYYIPNLISSNVVDDIANWILN